MSEQRSAESPSRFACVRVWSLQYFTNEKGFSNGKPFSLVGNSVIRWNTVEASLILVYQKLIKLDDFVATMPANPHGPEPSNHLLAYPRLGDPQCHARLAHLHSYRRKG
jgi:hypothetical protein